ncbi:hypothetical protein HCN44_008097 [Aphidius gifuensis]|uniref:Uncharacterized protein n=1 Tax=Aphidius gifuensis TaxID=684658 RepID=A0A834XN32_APHGI|nr:uncharacterized protein LOC122857811 [Aphidius gifuensis]KAF7989423.1 hypothetical protein HCN44_008097 [Aphidius gifuensis]
MVKKQKKLRDGSNKAKLQQAICRRSRICTAEKNRILRSKALKMLSQKQAEGDGGCEGNEDGSVTPSGISNGEGSKEFLSTGRTGRRNAMPDILGRNAKTGTADLSTRLEALTTDSEQDQAGPSGESTPRQ